MTCGVKLCIFYGFNLGNFLSSNEQALSLWPTREKARVESCLSFATMLIRRCLSIYLQAYSSKILTQVMTTWVYGWYPQFLFLQSLHYSIKIRGLIVATSNFIDKFKYWIKLVNISLFVACKSHIFSFQIICNQSEDYLSLSTIIYASYL